jgi:hypothetical protein
MYTPYEGKVNMHTFLLKYTAARLTHKQPVTSVTIQPGAAASIPIDHVIHIR